MSTGNGQRNQSALKPITCKIRTGEEVIILVEGDEAGGCRASGRQWRQRTTRALPRSQKFVIDDYEGEVMKIGEYAQFCINGPDEQGYPPAARYEG